MADYNGTDGFVYTVSDGNGGTATRISGNVLKNDFALENNALSAVLISGPAHGKLTLSANGDFVYTPDADYNGTDKFVYKARSQSGAESLATEVYLNLNPVNDAPVGVRQSVTTLEDTPIVLDLMGAFKDVDGDSLTLNFISQPTLGTLTPITTGADAGKWLYTPRANRNGCDSFHLRAWDGKAWSNSVRFTVNITPVNDAPTFVHDVYQVSPNTKTRIDLNSGLRDVDGDCVRIVSFQQPQHGTLSKDWYGNYYYTPSSGYRGADSFVITLSDGKVTSTATVNVQVGNTLQNGSTCQSVSFQALPTNSTSNTTNNTTSYVVVTSAAVTTDTTQSANIDWNTTADATQLQPPVSTAPTETTTQQPSLAELTGLVVRL